MSHFRVLWPDDVDGQLDDDEGGVAIAAIPITIRRPHRADSMSAVSRAQALFANRTCPYCAYPVVQPLELADPAYDRGGLPIPGSATLVGFHCRGCDAEWGV